MAYFKSCFSKAVFLGINFARYDHHRELVSGGAKGDPEGKALENPQLLGEVEIEQEITVKD